MNHSGKLRQQTSEENLPTTGYSRREWQNDRNPRSMDMVKITSREEDEDFHFYRFNRAKMSYAVRTLGRCSTWFINSVAFSN